MPVNLIIKALPHECIHATGRKCMLSVYASLLCILVRIGGFQPPLDDWKKILDDMNSRARKLEEEYEVTCTMKKV